MPVSAPPPIIPNNLHDACVRRWLVAKQGMLCLDQIGDPEAQPLSAILPAAMARGAMAIEAEIDCVFAAIDDANRLRCAHLAVAQWVHELDKLGRLHIAVYTRN